MELRYIRRALFLRLKKNKTIFNTVEWLKWHREINYQRQTNSIENLKPKDVIKAEERLIKDYWHCGTFHYYRYGLQYKKLTTDQLLDYVPTYYFHKNIETQHRGIDTIKFGDKLTQARLFAERGIPTAPVIAVYKNRECHTFTTNEYLDLQAFVKDKLRDKTNKLFFKPAGNCGGAGIFILKRDDKSYILNGRLLKSVTDLQSHLEPGITYIVEENIIQSRQISEINSSSVNTLRVVVQKESNQMVIRTCILRMGRKGKEVDNSAQGGISIKVDPETGIFADGATAEHGSGLFYEHPDSKFRFKGACIDNWLSIRAQIETIANKLIDFNDIALDIAITDRGAILVEFNFRYGVEHQQCVIGGIRKILNISNS